MIISRADIATSRPIGSRAFSLIEILIATAVLTIILLLTSKILGHATAISRTSNKRIASDTDARLVLDRIAVDIAKMLKRVDIDYFIKQPGRTNYPGNSAGHSQGQGNKASSGQELNDQMAFYTEVPGYYPSSGSQSSVSLVAYRVNGDTTSRSYLKLERMGKGLLWNGVSNLNSNNQNYTSPLVFLPLLIKDVWPAAALNSFNNQANRTASTDADYELVGPNVFRFEYYYLLKNGNVTDTPWNTDAGHTSLTGTGLSDVEAIVVAIAVIDPASRSLISDSSLFDLASDMADFKTAPGKGLGGVKKIGDMELQWNTVLVGTPTLPGVIGTGLTSRGSPFAPAAASAIRIYNRYYDLRGL